MRVAATIPVSGTEGGQRNAPRHRTPLRLHQILCADRGAERAVIGNELADELVQAGLENLLHPAVEQPRPDGTGLTLRLALAAIGGRDRIAEAHQVLVAACERTRQLRIEDEKIGDQPRLEA